MLSKVRFALISCAERDKLIKQIENPVIRKEVASFNAVRVILFILLKKLPNIYIDLKKECTIDTILKKNILDVFIMVVVKLPTYIQNVCFFCTITYGICEKYI